MNFRVEIEQEEDGVGSRVVDLLGVLAYGSISKEAQAKVQTLALGVVADRLEHGEADPDLSVSRCRRMSEWSSTRADVFWLHFSALAGSSNDNPVLTVHFPVPAGRILYSRFTILRRSIHGCLRALQNGEGSVLKTCRFIFKVTI